ncbi:DUF4012 domain-containing protein [Microbacterium sp. A84]|uniref:DUF4012 domain-containing protein n=1 Tax=Microbacterium sp. A84 TaxID=3450715 RepID=UPI003F4446DA
MPHVSRKEARAAAEQHTVAEAQSRQERRRKRARTTWLIVAIAAIMLLLAACWVGFRAITVKNGLEKSQQLISDVQNGGDVDAALAGISEHAASAGAAASDPVWAVLEWIPVAGDNLKGVRLAAQSLDLLVNDVALPVVNTSEQGQSLLSQLMIVAQAQSEQIGQLADDLSAVRESPFLIGQVRSGVELVDDVVGAAAPALEMLPTLLGADGARNYLLVFQNNAETLALGGSAAAQTLVNVDNGNISMGTQGNSGSYKNGSAIDVEVPQSATDLYTSYLVDHINTSMSRPDFPTAAQIMRAWWQRDIAPDQIDGVISIDPLALSRILVATGPIELPTGDVLTSDNAISLLLNDIYKRWDAYKYPDLVDGFFAAAAGAVFDKVATGSFNIKDMAWAINESASRGSILVWSDDEAVTEAIAGSRVSGILPTDNGEATTIGVYFNNSNGSKIDYYTETAVSAGAVCEANNATFSVDASISLPISQQEADGLPRYVQSMTYGTTFRDWVFVYGPPGTTLADATVNGEKASVMHRDIDDLGRPVVAFEAWFNPGQQVSVNATFTGQGEFGPLAVQTNPMIRGAAPVVTDGCAN